MDSQNFRLGEPAVLTANTFELEKSTMLSEKKVKKSISSKDIIIEELKKLEKKYKELLIEEKEVNRSIKCFNILIEEFEKMEEESKDINIEELNKLEEKISIEEKKVHRSIKCLNLRAEKYEKMKGKSRKIVLEELDKILEVESYKDLRILTGTFPTIDQFEIEVKRIGLGELSGLLAREILIDTIPVDESELAIGQSKIGGLPDLSESIKWPVDNNGKSLSFIAQINCTEAKHYYKDDLLPDNGILYFFYSAEQPWGIRPDDKDKFKVIYYDGDLEKFQRHEFPQDLPDDSRHNSKFNSCRIEFKSSYSLTSWVVDHILEKFGNLQNIFNSNIFSEKDVRNKLLGHPNELQAPMELQCEYTTNGFNMCRLRDDELSDEKLEELEKGKDEWRLLLQIDSLNNKAGMMWGDLGYLYFWIKKCDLENKIFDNCWVILQCY